MEAVKDKAIKIKATSLYDTKFYKKDVQYLLLKTELDDGIINIKLATGENSVNYNNKQEFLDNWHEDEVQPELPTNNEFNLKIFYKNNIPSIQYFNTGVSETDIIALLEVVKQEFIDGLRGKK